MQKKSKLKIVTLLTGLRFPLVLAFFCAAIFTVNSERYHPWMFLIAFTSLIAAAATDFFDGHLARRFNVVTTLGAHVDPLMDKFLYLACLPLLVYAAMSNGHRTHATILLVLTLLFLARDQWVTFLRSIGSIYNVPGNAHWSGKVRTAFNFPLLCAIYSFEEAPWPLPFFSWRLIYFLETFGVILTLLSLLIYTRRYWPSLQKSVQIKPDDQEKTP